MIRPIMTGLISLGLAAAVAPAGADVLSRLKESLGLGAGVVPSVVIQPCTHGYRCVTIDGIQTFLTSSTTKTDTYQILGLKEDTLRPRVLVKALLIDHWVLAFVEYDRAAQTARILGYDPTELPDAPAPTNAAGLTALVRTNVFFDFLTAPTTDAARRAADQIWREKLGGTSKIFTRITIDVDQLRQADRLGPLERARVELLETYVACLAKNQGRCELYPAARTERALEELRTRLGADFAKSGVD